MIINKGKNQQIEINKKFLDPVGTEKKNRSADKKSYILFGVLVIIGQLHYCLVALVSLFLGESIMNQAIEDIV